MTFRHTFFQAIIATLVLSTASLSYAAKPSKMRHQKFKKECLSDNAALKGKKLKACIQAKKRAYKKIQ